MTNLAERQVSLPASEFEHAPARPDGNPGLIALPLIIAGASGLGFTNTGLVDVPAAAVATLLGATSSGLLIATIWSAALRQNVNASVYGTFLGFYGSYGLLSVGLAHDWFGIPADGVRQTWSLWLGSWLLTIAILTVLTLRLPWTYPALLTVVDIALVLLLIGNETGGWATKVGGWFVFGFVALVIYYYVAALWEETGGKPLPLGRPLIA